MDYRKSRMLLTVCAGAAVLLVLVASAAEILWMGIAAVILMLAGFVQAMIFCRCPYCGAMFNMRTPLPRFCPNCGKELD